MYRQVMLSYTIGPIFLRTGPVSGRSASLVIEYDDAAANADGSYNILRISGSYKIDSGGSAGTYNVTGLAPIAAFPSGKPNDNKIFFQGRYVDNGGVTFKIDNAGASNDGQGNVNFYSTDSGYNEAGPNTSGADVTFTRDAPCFATGTMIRTARGNVAVEALEIGDEVVTVSGIRRPIQWIGRRQIDCIDLFDVWPVRVRAGAFQAGLPERNLWLSPGHPVLVGEHLVPIMCLINGTTIERMRVSKITYWHIELDQHDILLAEGLPAESFLDIGCRPWFEPSETAGALVNPDLVLADVGKRCRPVAIDGPLVEAERDRLNAVFAMSLTAASAWPEELGLPMAI